MRWLAAASVLLALPAFAQSIQIQFDPNMMGPPKGSTQVARTEEQSGNGYRMKYETNEQDDTVVKVLAPEGGHLEVWDGTFSWHSDDIPTSFQAKSDVFYRFVVTFPNGGTFEKKLQTKRGMTASLWVTGVGEAPPNVATAPPPPPPVARPMSPPPQPAAAAMSDASFAALKAAVEAESFSDKKLAVVQTAASSNWFTIDQVGQLVDLFSFGEHKVKTVGAVKSHIVDRGNAFQLYQRFTFAADKKKVEDLLRD